MSLSIWDRPFRAMGSEEKDEETSAGRVEQVNQSVRSIRDKTIAAKVKRKVFKRVVRPEMLFGLEMLALTKSTGGRAVGGRVTDIQILFASDD